MHTARASSGRVSHAGPSQGPRRAPASARAVGTVAGLDRSRVDRERRGSHPFTDKPEGLALPVIEVAA